MSSTTSPPPTPATSETWMPGRRRASARLPPKRTKLTSMQPTRGTDAGNRAQQANQTALQASNRLNTVEQVVGNIDQYQPTSQTEIRFRSGQAGLSSRAK